MLAFDHVVLPVSDLARAVADLHERLGLVALPGGRHPGFGTANRIVPLGGAYLEPVAVVDPVVAAGHPFGSFVARYAGLDARLCLRTGDLDAVAARLGLDPVTGSRIRPDGGEISWRTVGMAQAFGPEALPFFISWDGPGHPGDARAPHRMTVAGIVRVELGGDPDVIARWLGPHDLDLRVVDGPPGVLRVVIGTAEGPLVVYERPSPEGNVGRERIGG